MPSANVNQKVAILDLPWAPLSIQLGLAGLGGPLYYAGTTFSKNWPTCSISSGQAE